MQETIILYFNFEKNINLILSALCERRMFVFFFLLLSLYLGNRNINREVPTFMFGLIFSYLQLMQSCHGFYFIFFFFCFFTALLFFIVLLDSHASLSENHVFAALFLVFLFPLLTCFLFGFFKETQLQFFGCCKK